MLCVARRAAVAAAEDFAAGSQRREHRISARSDRFREDIHESLFSGDAFREMFDDVLRIRHGVYPEQGWGYRSSIVNAPRIQFIAHRSP